MSKKIITVKIYIEGMTCEQCAKTIHKGLSRMAGVQKASVDFSGSWAEVRMDPALLTEDALRKQIDALGYRAVGGPAKKIYKAAGLMLMVLALFGISELVGLRTMFTAFPQAREGMGYGMLLLIGVLTSFHCVAMCGGINLSQCLQCTQNGSGSAFRPSFLYNAGRVLSYTLIGGVVGLIGSVFSFNGAASGIIQIAAGFFMIIMGLRMMDIVPGLRDISFLPQSIRHKLTQIKGSGPLTVGILNGLVPCGPLQAMQLYALSTGSFIAGAGAMFLFSLGTVPVMFGFGAFSTMLGSKFNTKALTVGSVLIAVMGLAMLSDGLYLSGGMSTGEGNGALAWSEDDGIQYVHSQLSPRRYEAISVQAGIPVNWTITAEENAINGCNYMMVIPEYDITAVFEPGETTIEFMPEEAGTVGFSCWMGMIRSSITVID